jgi:hypothetical protein
MGANSSEVRCAPQDPGNFTVTGQVGDANGHTANASLVLEVTPNGTSTPAPQAPSSAGASPLLEYGLLAAAVLVALAVVVILARRRRPPLVKPTDVAPEDATPVRSDSDTGYLTDSP